jgi:two-component system, response regulator PdtaR
MTRNISPITAHITCQCDAVAVYNILVVEDDILIGMLLTDMLMELGHVVCGVERNEAGAVDAATRLRPDLMIVDAHLREGSGIAAIERIIRDRFVPHIFVTGDKLGTLLQRPMDIVIEKPFRERDLMQAIERAVASQQEKS